MISREASGILRIPLVPPGQTRSDREDDDQSSVGAVPGWPGRGGGARDDRADDPVEVEYRARSSAMLASDVIPCILAPTELVGLPMDIEVVEADTELMTTGNVAERMQ